MSRHLLDEKGDLFGIGLKAVVHRRQSLDVRRVFGKLAHPLNALLGKFLVRFNVTVHGGRVTVARKRFHLESRIDQRVTACKGIRLAARKNRIITDAQRQLLNNGFEFFGSAQFLGKVL